MPGYVQLTTARGTPPDPVVLLAAVKTATGDPTAVLLPMLNGTYHGKKAAPWSAADISAAQNLLDTTAALTPQLAAQRTIDNFPIEYKALVLSLIDAINVLRTHPAIGLAAVTPTQALASIRAKAGQL